MLFTSAVRWSNTLLCSWAYETTLVFMCQLVTNLRDTTRHRRATGGTLRYLLSVPTGSNNPSGLSVTYYRYLPAVTTLRRYR